MQIRSWHRVTQRILLGSVVAWGLTGATRTLPAQELPDYKPRTVINSPFPAITNAPFVHADETDLDDNELVIGLVHKGIARAYPINQLTGPRREIINDELAGTAIAATW